jgi:hypothetical protein
MKMKGQGHNNGNNGVKRLVGALGTMNLITLYGLLWNDSHVLGTGMNTAAGLAHVTRTKRRALPGVSH